MQRFACLMIVCCAAGAALGEPHTIDDRAHHLGDNTLPEWKAFTTPEARSAPLKIDFEAAPNATEFTLKIQHRDLHSPWTVTLNGVSLGQLEKGKDPSFTALPVPANTLVAGSNTLVINSRDKKDDVVIGPVQLLDVSPRKVLNLGRVLVTVNNAAGGHVPARLTIIDAKGQLAKTWYTATEKTAVRPGVVYMLGDQTSIELPAGDYVITATRGMEWSMAKSPMTIESGQTATLPLTIQREVDTTGWIAADTHIHTLTFSGHGDASIDERMITLPGEGVELAVATDHNHHTDYRPYQEKLGVCDHFTPVVGNEVTTKNGHFNAFPLPPSGKENVPDWHQSDWVKLIDDIRAHGAKVVILNHPRWPRDDNNPYGNAGLNRGSGDRESGPTRMPMDAMELVNSCDGRTDPLIMLTDWFALLNHGEKLLAVGTSDSHTVYHHVGQGRTYVPSSTDDPSAIDVDQACKAFTDGRILVSYGIFANATVNGKYTLGQVVPVGNKPVKVSLRVACASWVGPRQAIVYVNGIKVAEQKIEPHEGPLDTVLTFEGITPPHDGHLVCAVVGDPVDDQAYWMEHPHTFAATNPIYLDADGDGKYTTPRDTAAKRLADIDTVDQLRAALQKVDDAVAVQMFSLLREWWAGDKRSALDALARSMGQDRPLFAHYLQDLSTH